MSVFILVAYLLVLLISGYICKLLNLYNCIVRVVYCAHNLFCLLWFFYRSDSARDFAFLQYALLPTGHEYKKIK